MSLRPPVCPKWCLASSHIFTLTLLDSSLEHLRKHLFVLSYHCWTSLWTFCITAVGGPLPTQWGPASAVTAFNLLSHGMVKLCHPGSHTVCILYCVTSTVCRCQQTNRPSQRGRPGSHEFFASDQTVPQTYANLRRPLPAKKVTMSVNRCPWWSFHGLLALWKQKLWHWLGLSNRCMPVQFLQVVLGSCLHRRAIKNAWHCFVSGTNIHPLYARSPSAESANHIFTLYTNIILTYYSFMYWFCLRTWMKELPAGLVFFSLFRTLSWHQTARASAKLCRLIMQIDNAKLCRLTSKWDLNIYQYCHYE